MRSQIHILNLNNAANMRIITVTFRINPRGLQSFDRCHLQDAVIEIN